MKNFLSLIILFFSLKGFSQANLIQGNQQVKGHVYITNPLDDDTYIFNSSGTFTLGDEVADSTGNYISCHQDSDKSIWIQAKKSVIINEGVFGNVSIGSSEPDCSAKLQVSSTTQGFLPPRMTALEAEGIINPAEGLMIYSTDGSGLYITSKGWYGWNGSSWEKLNS